MVRLLEGNKCQRSNNGYHQYKREFTTKYQNTKNFNMSQKTRKHPFIFTIFSKLRFTPCKAEQPLRGIELKEKETKRLKHTGNRFIKNRQ